MVVLSRAIPLCSSRLYDRNCATVMPVKVLFMFIQEYVEFSCSLRIGSYGHFCPFLFVFGELDG